jgi:hypothetical protein
LLFVRLAIYTANIVAERHCRVSFTDASGIKHSVDVTADSLFEAAVRGVKALRSGEWNDPPGRAALLEIEVSNPAVRHTVSLQHVARWLNGASSSPRESMKKIALRNLLASK